MPKRKSAFTKVHSSHPQKKRLPRKRYESFDFGADRFAEAFESLESIIASYEMA